MPGAADIFGVIGGGLEGFARGLSIQRELEAEERRRLAEEARIRRQMELEDRRIALAEQTRRDRNNEVGLETMSHDRAAWEREQKMLSDQRVQQQLQAIQEEWLASLPPDLRAMMRGEQLGFKGAKREDFQSPEQREAERTRAAAQKREEVQAERDADFTDFQRRERFKKSLGGDLPITPKDDPALPMGVRDYLDSLLTKHQGAFEKAEGDFNQTWNQLKEDHPRLDPAKAREYLKHVFGYEKPSAASTKPNALDVFGQVDRPPINAPTSGRARGFGASPQVALPRERNPDPRGLPRPRSGNGDIALGQDGQARTSEAAAVITQARDARAVEEQERARRRGLDVGDLPITPLPRELRDGRGKPETMPVEVVSQSVDAPPERSPEADADRLRRLEQQARSLLSRLANTADTSQQDVLFKELERVKALLVAAGGK